MRRGGNPVPNDSPFDRAVFDSSQASPELRGIVEALGRLPRREAALEVSPEAAQAARRQFDEGPFVIGPASPRAAVRSLPGPAGDVSVRVFVPAGEVRGALLHLHGGGWLLGRASMGDRANEALCDALSLAVVSVDYRLAPENPYPAGPDDCEAAAVWLAKNAQAELGAPPERIFVGGESAGGHLAAVTLLRMRDRHGFRFRAANLVYGVYDLSGVPSHTAFDGRNLILDSENIAWFTRCFVPDEGLRRHPDVSPLYADLAGLPPALFTVGTFDPLLDHTLFLYSRWLAAGSPAELAVYPGAPHGFDAFPVPEGRRAHARMADFLRRQLTGD
jgi:acetyl esterase/lipase